MTPKVRHLLDHCLHPVILHDNEEDFTPKRFKADIPVKCSLKVCNGQ